MEHRLFLFAIAAFISLSGHAAIITHKSVVKGVTVAVTAGNLDPEATVWEFAVVLRATDNKILPDDLAKNAVLVDPGGRQYPVLAWEGAAAQTQHRAGVLKFIAPTPRPHSIELRIMRPGEKKPRSFSWLLGTGLVASR